MGDSITDWWRRAGADLYAQIFEPLRCADFGIAGDRMQGVLWRMEDGEYREPIRQINELIADLDDGEYVRFMDIGGHFLEPDGSISEEVMPDGLHPSARGYQIWGDAVMPTFREMMGLS